jgi:O-antigen/teichoic acid export membrane protein
MRRVLEELGAMTGRKGAADVIDVRPSSDTRRSPSESSAGARSLASDTALLLTGQYGSAGLSLLATMLAAGVAGPDAYGRAALAVALPLLAWSLTSVKSGTVTTRYFSQSAAGDAPSEAAAFFRLGLGIDLLAAIAALGIVVVAWAVSSAEPDGGSVTTLSLIFALSLPFSSFSGTAIAFLTARRKFVLVAAIQLIEKGILLLLTAVLLPLGYEAAGIVVALAVSQALTGIGGLLLSLNALRASGLTLGSGSLPRSGPRWTEIRSALAWNYLSSTTGGVLANVPLLALGALRSPVEAGYCRLALSLMNVSAYLEAAMARATYPRFAAEQSPGELGAVCARLSLRAGLPALCVLFVVVLVLPLVIPGTLGAEYSAMVLGAQIMVTSVGLTTSAFWIQPLLYATGQFRAWALVSGGVAVSVAAFAWPIAAGWGFLGAAALVALARVSSYVVAGWLAVRSLRESR